MSSPSQNLLSQADNDDEITLEVKVRKAAKVKQKGNAIERLYANIFKNMHKSFEFCKTTRATSSELDGCGIDLNYLPFIVQIKAGIQKTMNVRSELLYIKERIKSQLPPNSQYAKQMRFLIHHDNKPITEQRRREEDTLVTMTFADFEQLLKAVLKNQK